MLEKNKRNNVKTEIQDKAVNLIDRYKNIVLEWATGCGKTLASLRMIEKLQLKYPGRKGLIVFKESTHKRNWLDDIKKHCMERILNDVELIMYASLHKTKQSYYDYIVLDECHAITWKRLELLKEIILPTTKLILLSATIPDDKRYLISKLDDCAFKYATISLDQAINKMILPKPIIYVHKVKLTKKQIVEYGKIERKLKYFQRKGMYASIKTTGLARKKLIALSKVDKATAIISRFEKDNKRFVCFTFNIEQAGSLSKNITRVVSSKKPAKQNQLMIDEFNIGNIDELFAVKMLREGINLTNINAGLIVQVDSEPLAFYQMLGRCLRSEHPEMHMILCEGTHDRVYFDNIMDKSLLKYVKYV